MPHRSGADYCSSVRPSFQLEGAHQPRQTRPASSAGGMTERATEPSPASIPSLRNRGRAAPHAGEELTEFGVDVLVAPMHEVVDVLDNLQHGAALVQRLGRHPGAVAVVDAVVSPLKDGAKPLFELVDRGLSRRVLIVRRLRQVVRLRDAERAESSRPAGTSRRRADRGRTCDPCGRTC